MISATSFQAFFFVSIHIVYGKMRWNDGYKCLLFLNFARQTINGNWLQVRNKAVSGQLKKRWTRHAIGLVQSNLRRIEKLNSHVTCWNCGSLLCMTGHLYLYCMLCEHQVTVTIDLSRVLFIFLDRVFCHFTHLMKKKKKKLFNLQIPPQVIFYYFFLLQLFRL